MMRGEWDELNIRLKHVDVKTTNEVMLVGWVRLTHIGKDKLPEYDKLLNRIAIEFIRRGLDEQTLLHGLL